MSYEVDDVEHVEDAWREFRATLADRIAERAEGDHILWELEVPERLQSPTGPYVQVGWHDLETPVAEVASSRVMAPQFRLRKQQRRLLREMGWRGPDEDHLNYWLEVQPQEVDQVAVKLVSALRDVFDVVHPACLVDRFNEGFEVPEWREDPLDTHLPITAYATSLEELDAMVEVAIAEALNEPTLLRDDDGDLPLRCGTAMVFVRVLPDASAIRIFSELVVDIEDETAAGFEVAVLNRDQEFKFVLRDSRVIMSVELPASPFVPEHVNATLDRMCQLAPQLDADLAHRVRGKRFLEPLRGGAAWCTDR